MRTVHAVSKLSGVSIRTLHYYDTIGLLSPTTVTEAGYRLYDDAALERLQQILLFRELAFPLKEIRAILDRPGFDRAQALEQQIGLLTLQRERIDELIAFARGIQQLGEQTMDFSAFDRTKLDAYAAEAKKKWGETEAYHEFTQKSEGRTKERQMDINKALLALFAEFGALRGKTPEDAEVRAQVEKLRAFLTEHFYNCTPEILAGLGEMYAAGGEMTENIDAAGGEGTGAFVRDAIRAYCGK